MTKFEPDPSIIEKARGWLEGNYDENTKEDIRRMLEEDPQELTDAFYRNLEFGTGGLRGIMGTGTNRMNKYTVGMATQGLVNYLKEIFREEKQIRVAIAYDSRNNSRYFAEVTADVFTANGIRVYLFDDLRPTPELSFAIRHFNCQSGIVITASHNPKEYNGYKAYWSDGGQLIPPHDKNVIDEVNKIKSIDEVKFGGNRELLEIIGEEVDNIYIRNIKDLSLSKDIIKKHNDLRIVYTPLHGTGADMVPRCLNAFGFKNIFLVDEQATPDGNFPTVHSPNPEEHSAMEMAIEKARDKDANLVMATDPDADRVGIAVRKSDGEFILLNGNQTASLLIYYLLNKWKESGKLDGNQYIVKTIVTTGLLNDIAIKNDVECYDVLTGFKWIAEIIRKLEGKKVFIAGGEESYGYMIGDFTRDKDAVSSCAFIAETAAWAADQGKTLYDLLIDIYLEHDFYKEKLLSIVRKGKSGAEEIQAMMKSYREDPPAEISGRRVVKINDYLLSQAKDTVENTTAVIDLPKSNVLQFFLEDGSKISIRPSGTEPKIKFYFSVQDVLESREHFGMKNKKLDERLDNIIRSLNLE